MVAVVADVQIVQAVDRHRQGIAHPDGRDVVRIDIARIGGEVGAARALSKDEVRGCVAGPGVGVGRCQRLIEFEHAMIARVGDVEIVIGIRCEALRITQPGRSLRTGGLRKIAALPEDQVRRENGANCLRERLSVFEHPIVAGVRNIEIADAVHRHAAGLAQATGALASSVAKRGLKIGLADFDVCRLAIGEAGGVEPSEDAAVGAVDDVQ
jgi:hypothetical protein